MRPLIATLDRYLLVNVAGTLTSVFAIVLSLMLFEHLPRLFTIVSLTGRKTYIVAESMISLLPEYAGIGLLFGLYLATALTTRRLSLRGELDIFEAAGVSPCRWFRFPMLVALAIAVLLLWTQGWLVPAGERRLAELGRQLESGRFGYQLETGQFIDLGDGITVRFERVEPTTGKLADVFFKAGGATFTANRGRLGMDMTGHVIVDLENGRMINSRNSQSLEFSRFHFDSDGRSGNKDKAADQAQRLNGTALPALLISHDAPDRAEAYSRLLWPIFALLVPVAGFVLGKSSRRAGSSLGLMAGLILVVLFVRTAGFVASTRMESPGYLASIVAAGWAATAGLLVYGERRWGAGYVDSWLRRVAAKRRIGKRSDLSGRDLYRVREHEGRMARDAIEMSASPEQYAER